MTAKHELAPHLKFYGDTPAHLNYPDCSMIDLIERNAKAWPNLYAHQFFGARRKYREFIEDIHTCAKALRAIGIQAGDKVTICMPNTPQALVMFYAINRIGAIANMVHPLSGEEEIAFFLNFSKSKAAITLEQFYPKFANIRDKTAIQHLIIASVKNGMPRSVKMGYELTQGRKISVPTDANVIWWKNFMKLGKSYKGDYLVHKKGSDVAAILYSGGTTGTMKGIELTNLNFNALAMQTAAAGQCLHAGHTMLAIMPIFHGFGLGVCIHTMLVAGAKCLLVPQFTVKTYAALLKKHKPHYIAGVPTLYEALLRMEGIDGLDLSQLEGVFSGGDSLSPELKHKVDDFLRAHGASVQVREGYGTTECVTASCLTPPNDYREGSIGIPFPDTYYKIVIPSTIDEVEYGQVGEICLTGPTVMAGYLDNPKETMQTLQLHDDGRIWLHTGDLGSMDADGFIYFKQRLKRMIVTSGYNVYPSQLENIIDSHPAVLMSTVIGVKDDYKIQKPKAFVVLRPGYTPTEQIQKSIREHCARNMAKYAIPYEFEYRDSLPKTLVGKVAYRELEKEEAAKHSASHIAETAQAPGSARLSENGDVSATATTTATAEATSAFSISALSDAAAVKLKSHAAAKEAKAAAKKAWQQAGKLERASRLDARKAVRAAAKAARLQKIAEEKKARKEKRAAKKK